MRVRVASAGTGKTTSLVARYLTLVGEGVPLRRVAGVTFTRDVADELRQRVAQGIHEVRAHGSYLGGLYSVGRGAAPRFESASRELGGALLTTIHGFMIAGIRLSAPLLGYDPGFALLPEWEARALFEEELRSLGLVTADPDHPLHAAAVVAGEEGMALAAMLFDNRSLARDLVFGDGELETAVGVMYGAAYDSYLRRLGSVALAPGEVERAALRMLDVATVRERLARRYPIVLVDEYQDVNPLQGAFFERLAEAGVALEVVGDPKQSIYGFRSADVAVFRRALDAAERSGELLEPLTASRRHARAVVRFLNRLTGALGAAGLGFDPREAPPVEAAGAQAAVEGRVDVVVVEGHGRLADLRRSEAEVLAERLEAAHAAGTEYSDMAVVARTHALLSLVERALEARDVPSMRLKGTGFYWRNEIRDVYHALRVGADPAGSSLTAFLRGPFASLGLAQLAAVMTADDPLAVLAAEHPRPHAVIGELGRFARLAPLDAVKAVVRTPLASGVTLMDRVDERGRDNIDALLFEIASQPPSDLDLLLDRLDELAKRADAADVPSGGDGVRLLTVHGSKGLEFRVVALFDTGFGVRDDPYPALVDPATGRVSLNAAGGDEAAQRDRRERDRHESYRLLYVAASRARDQLILTGSKTPSGPRGWLATLLDTVLVDDPPDGTVLTTVAPRPLRRFTIARPAGPEPRLPSAPWTLHRFEPEPFEPLLSPSRLVGLQAAAAAERGQEPTEPVDGPPRTGADDLLPLEADEPMALGESPLSSTLEADWGDDQQAGGLDDLPGRGRVIGTLVHYAISQDWTADDEEQLETLRAQEVMFPYSGAQQDDLIAEVAELLGGYRALLGRELAGLDDRDDDRAEIPLAMPGGSTVWEGVIDRLYRVDGRWYVDDYKTDRLVRPERYHLQLGLYLHAVEQALGTRPVGRLVYLRSGTVVEPDDADLRAALQSSGVLASNR